MALLKIMPKPWVQKGIALRGRQSVCQGSAPGSGTTLRMQTCSCLDTAFTMLESLIVVTVAGIIAAMVVPQAYQAIKAYRLHADASALADQLNLARMRAASQFAPYGVVVNTASGTYWREELCGDTSTSTDSACTSVYNAFTTPLIEGGTQYALEGDSFSGCRPTAIGASSYPGTIQADPSPCPDPVEIYFNTRGAPVDSSGDPLGNGGAVIYIRNQYNLVDAVTVAIGGAVTVWNWDAASSSWVKR